ncbi:MAG: head maturation protease, ClpP-related [Chthoniobacterales bacterium]
MTIDLFSEISPGDVEGFAAKVKSAGRQPITLRINSPGGNVSAGFAMLALLQAHHPGVRVEILGLAASMASVLAMAGRPVRIAANAMVMIHNPWTSSQGDSGELRRTADLLDRMRAQLVEVYASRAKISPDEIGRLMDAETWLDAEQAVKLGFADEIAGRSPTAIAGIHAGFKKFPLHAEAAAARLMQNEWREVATMRAKVAEERAKLSAVNAALADVNAQLAAVRKNQILLEGLAASRGLKIS